MENSFALGRILLTERVDRKMKEDESFRHFVMTSLGKHANCRWGNVSAEDKERNDRALETGERILSVYIRSGKKKDDEEGRIWIITEADRSATTILFPDEY